MRDKRSGKEKLNEEKSLFLEFPRVALTEIIATQPLSRDPRPLLHDYLSK